MKSMENNKQTAVSFLLRELRIEDLAKGKQLSVVLHICEEAKQMEKKQIIKAYKEFLDTELPHEVYEQYYNEEYGGNK